MNLDTQETQQRINDIENYNYEDDTLHETRNTNTRTLPLCKYLASLIVIGTVSVGSVMICAQEKDQMEYNNQMTLSVKKTTKKARTLLEVGKTASSPRNTEEKRSWAVFLTLENGKRLNDGLMTFPNKGVAATFFNHWCQNQIYTSGLNEDHNQKITKVELVQTTQTGEDAKTAKTKVIETFERTAT